MLNIITNIASMSASRSLNKNQAALAQSFNRLSTGLRINSAKDDAAGLAISNRLTAQYRGLVQASRNATDAMSMFQTADAAIAEQQNMVQRLRELAVQASSDNNNASDRAALQSEADALVSEIDRISSQTEFNGRKLLDGTLSNMNFQIGADSGQTISATIQGLRTTNLGTVYTSTGTVTEAAVTANNLTIANVTVGATTADGVSSVNDTFSALAKANAINAVAASSGVTATVVATTYTGASSIGASDLAATGDLEINGVDIFDENGGSTISWSANDATGSLRAAINAVSAQTGVVATVSTAGELVLTAADGRNLQVVSANGGGAGAGADLAADVYYGGLSLKSENAYTIGGAEFAVIGAGAGSASAVNIQTIDFSSTTVANTAIDTLDNAIDQLNSRQAQLGALMNRMDYAVSSLQAAAENTAATRAQIRDADFAAETAAFSKNQILQQASASMLAQANVQSQLALQLLG